MKSWAIVAATTVFILSVNVGATNYTLIELGTLGSGSEYQTSYATGVNSNGQVVGYASTGSLSQTHAFIYSNGVMQDIGTLGGGYSYAHDINDNSQVVGRSISTSNDLYQYNAFLYDNTNGMQDLGALGGSTSQGNSINISGNIVGNYVDVGGNNRAFSYINSVMQDLGSPLGGASVGANGINNINQVTGTTGQLNGQTSPPHAFLDDNGSVEDLSRGIFSTTAYDINDSGQVVGRGWPDGIGKAHLFDNDGSVLNLGSLGSGEFINQSQATAINNVGQVVGWSYNDSNQKSAFLYDSGEMMELCVLVDCMAYGWDFLEEATDINDNGDIVGYGSFGGTTRAFIITIVFADGDLAPLGSPDGNINAGDVLIAVRIALGEITPSTLELAHGDMNADGVINLSDVIVITKHVLNQ